MARRLFHILVLVVATALSVSCGSAERVAYFQDIEEQNLENVIVSSPVTIRPGDKLSIVVSSRNMQLANLFNLPYVPNRVGPVSESVSTSYTQGVVGYTVDSNGNIDFPVLGTICVSGMSRSAIAEYIKGRLVSEDLCSDAVVTVDYMNLHVSVFGEVAHPGRFVIDNDRYTIYDALSAAGDLTIYGVRENVKVVRTTDGVQKTYSVNLCSARDVASSPVYYLQQNDMVYVEPNRTKARQSTVNGNNILSTSFWMSLASLALNISYFFFR